MDWVEEPYPPKKDGEEVAEHIFPFSQMGTVWFNDGAKGAVAWLPKPFCLVVDVPDRKMLYRLDLADLLAPLDEDYDNSSATSSASPGCQKDIQYCENQCEIVATCEIYNSPSLNQKPPAQPWPKGTEVEPGVGRGF
jgi:hypothetical protein